jgi:hypothetical protein
MDLIVCPYEPTTIPNGEANYHSLFKINFIVISPATILKGACHYLLSVVRRNYTPFCN